MPTREFVRRFVRQTFKLDKKDRRTEEERKRDKRMEDFVQETLRGKNSRPS